MMIDNIILRSGQIKDIPEIRQMMAREKQILSDGEVWSAKSIKIYIAGNLVLIAEHDEKIVGFIIAEKLLDDGVLIQLRIVSPDFRGRGIGTFLSDYFEKTVIDMGIKWMLSYARPNVAKFHKSRGATLCTGYTEVYKEF